MSDTPAVERTAAGALRRHAATTVLWAIQGLLAFQFAGAGLFKLSGAPAMMELFAAIGAGQWLRLAVGTLEVVGAIGLLIPRLAGPAALGLGAVMVGATVANMLILDSGTVLTLGLLLLCALVAWAHWPRIVALVTTLRAMTNQEEI